VLAITRLDVVFRYVRGVVPPPGAEGESWWEAVWRAGIVGRRQKRPDAWEDRFIVGRRDLVLSLASLEDRFPASFQRLGNQSWPEKHIAAHLERAGATHTPARAGPFFEHFVVIRGFRQNKRKYAAGYIQAPAPDEVGRVVGGRGRR